MVRNLPAGIYDWPFANLDYAVASMKPDLGCCLNQVYVSPLEIVVMYIVRDLAQ